MPARSLVSFSDLKAAMESKDNKEAIQRRAEHGGFFTDFGAASFFRLTMEITELSNEVSLCCSHIQTGSTLSGQKCRVFKKSGASAAGVWLLA